MLEKPSLLHDPETATELKVTRSAWRRFFFPDNLRPPPFREFWGRYVSLILLSVVWSVLLHHHRLWLSWDLDVGTVWAFGIEFQWEASTGPDTHREGFSDFVNAIALVVRSLISVFFIGACLSVYGWKKLLAAVTAPSFKIVAKYVVLATAFLILGGYLLEWLGCYSGDPKSKTDRPLHMILVMSIFVGLVGPLAEEICVRLTLYQLLRTRFSFLWAALFSGVTFGLMHFGYPDPMKMVGATLAGLVLAWSYERTNSILTPIGIHVLNNTWMAVFGLL